MRIRAVVLAAAFATAPLGAKAADLVVWWQEGYYTQEDEALAEIAAAFQQKTGKEVEITFYPEEELPTKIKASLEAGHPPDFAYGLLLFAYITTWARDGHIADLSETVGFFSDLFDPDALDRVVWLDASTGQKGLYGVPIGRSTNHLHVWKSLLERAGSPERAIDEAIARIKQILSE